MPHENVLHIQINNYDTYQTSPNEIDNLYRITTQVPILRIYGALVYFQNSTKHNHNILIHVHNYYPYIYLSCDFGFVQSHPDHVSHITDYLESFVKSLVKKVGLNDVSSLRSYIAKVSLCKAIPVYGYRVGYKLYYKISFVSPLYKSRFVNSIDKVDMSQFSSNPRFKFQVFESHLNFTSQFLTDFNLYSCDWIKLSDCYFRAPVFNGDFDPNLNTYVSKFMHNNIVNYPRIGRSLLEIDIKTSYINNRHDLNESQLHHSFSSIAAISHPTPGSPTPGSTTTESPTTESPTTESPTTESTTIKSPTSTINLTSLNSIIGDIDYQSNLNQLNFEFSDDFTNLDYFATKWPNDLHLRSLLDYSITLTKPWNQDLNSYQQKIIDPINKAVDIYPTIFQSVDIDSQEISKVVYDLVIGDLPFKRPPDIIENEFDNALSKELDKELDQEFGSDKDVETSDKELEGSDKEFDELDKELEFQDQQQQVLDQQSQSPPNQPDEAENSINDSQIFTQTLNPNPIVKAIEEPLSTDPLSKESIINNLQDNGILKINYPDPYYDNPDDIAKPIIFGNKRIKVPLKQEIPNFPSSHLIKSSFNSRHKKFRTMQYTISAPSKKQVIESYNEEMERKSKFKKFKSQLDSVSNNFKISINEKVDRSPNDFVHLTNLIMELHVNTTTNKLPNPDSDEVSVIFYKFDNSNHNFDECTSGFIVNGEQFKYGFGGMRTSFRGTETKFVENEDDLVKELIKIVYKFDPDILSGFEINSMSWGYLIERFRNKDIDIVPQLSKTTLKNTGKIGDRWGYTHTSNISISGRYTLNVWRLLRRDLTLNNYSFENCCYHIFHSTFPKFSNLQLTKYLTNKDYEYYLAGLNYYMKKVLMIQYFISSQELITKNTEHSRLIGIDFNSNFYRGSQFKVESILSRFAKNENYLLNSPTKLQVHRMKPLEQIPLIMEPDSNFYKSPLIVLDFQSLYPSIVIAYNYCYSTILCKLDGFNPNKNILGYLSHVDIHPFLIDFLYKNKGLNISPNGYVFINQKFRKSLIGRMLSEILTMRINIKKFLGLFKKEQYPQLYKVFNSRQMALKLIANVTYGYTSASFSGRMPNSDIADAIVATGRELLTKSIDFIESSNYGAKVVYGDTDSLFVYLPGKSKSEAFEIGDQLSKSITKMFPDPIKLKFEKVYHPCVLLSKKRYVGFSYEYPDQIEPKFDAKGIETIRRDGIPAQQKILEKCLKILFETSNLSLVKKYVVQQFTKVLSNKIIISDFCFAKEVRYGTYKKEAYLPPGAIVARKKMEQDERSEPQYKERVPYVVIRDASKTRLRDRCISPEEFIESFQTSKPFSLDYEYYITKVLIPPLERIFNLMGCNIREWYDEVPKPKESDPNDIFTKSFCLNCGDVTSAPVCDKCMNNKYQVVIDNEMKVKNSDYELRNCLKTCDDCVKSNLGTTVKDWNCINQDCFNYYGVIKYRRGVDRGVLDYLT